jgi:hypothetical protein
VTPEVADLITYTCVYCRSELVMPSGGWDGWVRCRSCGRVFLPPEFESLRHISRGSGLSGPGDHPQLDVGSPNGQAGLQVPLPISDRIAHTSPTRLVFTTGFVLCLLLTLIKFLDFSPGGMAIFGFLTLVFFLLLMRTPRKRLRQAGATWARSNVETTSQNDSELSSPS